MKKKILIADDSDFFARIIEIILEPVGYAIIRAKRGCECLDMVREERPALLLLDIILPDMSGFDVCKILREDDTNNLMPILMLTSKDDLEDKLIGLELGADDYITKPFSHRELLIRVNNTIKRVDRNRDANPLTGLPGNVQIQREINKKIANESPYAVVYADLDNFKAYNDAYGFSSGDVVLKMTADILSNRLHECGNKSDFVGHIGGDDFIVVTTPDDVDNICNSIISEFDHRIRDKYSMVDLERGLIFTSNRAGELEKFPLMTISLAVVTNEDKTYDTYLRISEVAAELKKKAKAIEGSNFVKDQRIYSLK